MSCMVHTRFSHLLAALSLNAAASAMTFEACVEKALTLKSSLPKDTGSHCTVVGAGRGVDARSVYIFH